MIDRRWLPLNALRAFEAAGRQLSFTAAASALSVSQSAVSRHVISLEGLLGVPLFERRRHQLGLTDAGAVLLPEITKAFDRMQQAVNDAVDEAGGRPRTLRVHMPPSFAQLLAVPILRGFRRHCPDVLLDIDSPNSVGPPLRDADAAVVYGKPVAGDHVSDVLWMARETPACTPDIARRHAGLDLGAFLAANELLHVKLEHEPRNSLWHAYVRQNGLSLDTDRGLAFDTATLAAQYALSGEGVVLLDVNLFAADLAAGRLVAPFNTTFESGYGYFLVVQLEDLADPAIAQLRSWIIEHFALRREAGLGVAAGTVRAWNTGPRDRVAAFDLTPTL